MINIYTVLKSTVFKNVRLCSVVDITDVLDEPAIFIIRVHEYILAIEKTDFSEILVHIYIPGYTVSRSRDSSSYSYRR
jgi:hypothetical protein